MFGDAMLAELRARAGQFDKGKAMSTEDALVMVEEWYRRRQEHEQKLSSLTYRLQLIEVLRRTLPKTSPAVWTAGDVAAWWASPGVTAYSATRRNGMLDTLRKMFALMLEKELRKGDPSAGIRRIPVRARVPSVPSQEDFKRIVESIESRNSDFARESARFVRFLAYSGCRIGEARAVEWQDVGRDVIAITGGETGTKNREVRYVPVIARMRELLESMRYDGASGHLFSIKSPRFALSNACRRLGIAPVTPHTLRHLFATTCIESGVDVPTVAKWLGHKDGGALLMTTYAHLRDQHSLEQAAKVGF